MVGILFILIFVILFCMIYLYSLSKLHTVDPIIFNPKEIII